MERGERRRDWRRRERSPEEREKPCCQCTFFAFSGIILLVSCTISMAEVGGYHGPSQCTSRSVYGTGEESQ